MEKNMKPTRHFGGETEFALDYSSPEALEKSKQHRHFHQRMLRAYLKGKEYFHFGRSFNKITGKYDPIPHRVLEVWK